MSSDNVLKFDQDITPLANISLINQGFLRTILETQSKILAYMEDRDQEEVIEGLYSRVNEDIRHAIDQHQAKFPGAYSIPANNGLD